MDYVTSRMDIDLKCEYLVNSYRDIILIPSEANVTSVYVEIDKKDKAGKRKVHRLINKKSHGFLPEQKAIEIGLYFEELEYERLKSEFPSSSYQVIHRYPLIDSSIQRLNQNNISCDIDVKCVEVKAISVSEETPFNLTLRQWDSRVWCRRHRIPYEIVVYYHFRYQVISRFIIKLGDKLKRKPSGYFCSLA